MNFLDKIMSESKTHKAAAEKIDALVCKIGFTMADPLVFVKSYKAGKPYGLEVAENLIKAEAEWQEKQSINYLLNHMPLDAIDRRLQEIQESVEEWAGEFVKNPSYKLEWADGMFKLAAEQKVLSIFRGWISKVEDYDRDGYWAEREAEILKYALRGASHVPSSTSVPSNHMEARITEAWALATDHWSTTIGRVRHWFRQVEELGVNINEELAKRAIDIKELAKAILKD